MIKLGGTRLDLNGLRIKQVKGLHDFPQLKTDGAVWSDVHYTQPLNRLIDFQYKSRKITLDCFVVASNWSAMQTRLNNIATALVYDDLRMLVLSDYSYRGYMVRLKKSTLMKPARYYQSGKSVAEFKLVFEEPQPFNVQWTFIYPPSKLESLIDFRIIKMTKSLSYGSDEQQYIRVCFNNEITDINLEQEDYVKQTIMPVTGGIPYPVVVLGELDMVQDISIQVNEPTGSEVTGLDTAAYYLRNGLIV